MDTHSQDAEDVAAAPDADCAQTESLAHAKRVVEAALLVSANPLTPSELARLFEPALDGDVVRRLLDEIREDWAERSVVLAQVASGWRFQARPEFQRHLERLDPEKPPRYSRAAMETLAIVAYQQPVTRGDIEAIRGVAVSSNVIKALEDRQWVEVVGHKETPGRPALYATTKTFLDDLGLRSLAELPPLADLDPSHLLEFPDAPSKAAEAELALASPLPGVQRAGEQAADDSVDSADDAGRDAAEEAPRAETGDAAALPAVPDDGGPPEPPAASPTLH
jgi:segregation and condensation protein B